MTFRKSSLYGLLGMMLLLFITSASVQPLMAQQLGNTRWVQSVPNFDDSLSQLFSVTPAVASDGTIYITAPQSAANSSGSNPTVFLYAFNSAGDTLWKTKLYDINFSGSQGIFGPILGPDGTIHAIGQTGSSQSTLFAINPDGSIRWKKPLSSSGSVPGGGFSVGPEGTIYLVGAKVGALSETGAEKWTVDPADPKTGAAVDKAGNLYYVSTSDALISLSPDGNTRWQYDFSQTIDGNTTMAITGKNDIIIPVAAGDKVVSISQGGSKNWEFDDQGNLQFPTTNFMYSPIVSSKNKIIFADHQEKLYALNSDGTLSWSRQLPFTNFDDPGFSTTGVTLTQGNDGTLFINRLGPIFFGTEVLALEPGASGNVKWRYKADSIAELGPVYPPKVHSQNIYYTGGTQNKFQLRAIVAESQNQAQSSWPVSLFSDNQNTSRAGVNQKSCELTPKTEVFPPFINPSFGRTYILITGFKDSNHQPSDIKASSVTLTNASPNNWWTLPSFTLLEYKNQNLEFDSNNNGGFFNTAELSLTGELKSSGCFKTTVNVLVWS